MLHEFLLYKQKMETDGFQLKYFIVLLEHIKAIQKVKNSGYRQFLHIPHGTSKEEWW